MSLKFIYDLFIRIVIGVIFVSLLIYSILVSIFPWLVKYQTVVITLIAGLLLSTVILLIFFMIYKLFKLGSRVIKR